MKSPIFDITRAKLKEELKFPGTLDMAAIEQKAAQIVAEVSDDLLMAWLAETGHKPSESVICHQFRDGHMRVWVETKDENDRRAVAKSLVEP